MTTQQPEPQPQADQPERVAEPNPAHETDEFVAPQEGEQGEGDLEPGDDSDNPMAGLEPAEIERVRAEQDDADADVAAEHEDRTAAYADRLAEQQDDGADAAERLGAQQDS